MMSVDAHIELSQHVARVLLERSDWSLDALDHPVLRIEAYVEEKSQGERTGRSTSVFSQVVDLSATKSSLKRSRRPAITWPPPGQETIATRSVQAVEAVQAGTGASNPDVQPEIRRDDEPEVDADGRRMGTGGLRLARSDSSIVEDTGSQRQIHSGDRFPKRRKSKPEGHFLQPSTLDKLIGGIWEQIHGSLALNPRSLVEQLQLKESENGVGGLLMAAPMTPFRTDARSREDIAAKPAPDMTEAFSRSNVFCRNVTQASRACRSLEVIVQARWVEYFDAYVDQWAQANRGVPRSRYNKAALAGACADFGWTEKELRNKMYVWRGYKEIKDAGGWVALVFAGMGIYRFCKYRIGFDKDSMQRLKQLRPAMEVAADTLHPQWRQLLTVLGEPSDRLFHGHPHDWVVRLDGREPIPLRNTYLQWDPQFSYRQLDDCVVDETVWGGEDPRWSAPSVDAIRRASATWLPTCETCNKEQSDDPKTNNCYCFPTLFGSAATTTSPVMVFRTPDGKNNGLLALCAFERGAPVGEFIGVITKGFQDVDVMEGSTSGLGSYQIWQGRQGNFTRFVNHSCKANAQYQRFTWLNTQRTILVSKGIDAGTEVTVDYSEKYWKGLDKICLCGESCCRYKKDGS